METLAALFDNKVLAILAVLVNDTSGGLYLREISKYSKVPDATTFRIINKLEQANLLDITKIKNLKLYRLKDIPNTHFLFKLMKKEERVLDLFINKVKENMSIDLAILIDGGESNQRASVLLVGDVISSDKVKEIAGEIKINHNFTINPTVLNNESYQGLVNSGQISGNKKVLFSR